jgi:hypothetical protein
VSTVWDRRWPYPAGRRGLWYQIFFFDKTWASRSNIWDSSATPSGIKRAWYVCIFGKSQWLKFESTLYNYTCEPLRLRTGAMLILECFSTILRMLYTSMIDTWGARWPRVQCARRTLAEVKQRWSVKRWVTKNLLSRAHRASEGILSRWSRLNL